MELNSYVLGVLGIKPRAQALCHGATFCDPKQMKLIFESGKALS